MNGSDDEFEDFIKRRKAVFERPPDEQFEPPPELDRLVLRQAREAIRPEEPMRVFSAPRWSMPLALAATLVLAFTIIFQAGMPGKPAPRPEVTVQNVTDRVDSPLAGAAAASPPSPAPMESPRSAMAEAPSRERAVADATTAMNTSAAAKSRSSDAPAWRRDKKSWLAEIERLRAAGDSARADAEMAEFNRQQRAYAVAPDR